MAHDFVTLINPSSVPFAGERERLLSIRKLHTGVGDTVPRASPSLSLDVRADERRRVRRLLSPRLLLHSHVRDAVLLLADLPGGRPDDARHQSGLSHHQR